MVPTADRFFERDHPLARWARTAASRFPTILAAEAPDAEASAEAAPAEDPRESSGEISRSEVASALEKKPSEERSGGPAAAPPPAGRDGGPESAFSSPQDFDEVTAHVVELIPLHLERVATRCYALLGDWRLTEEAVQETMVNLLRTARRCPPRSDEEAVAGWINDMARRVCLDVLRRRAVATSADAADSGPRVERRGHDRGTQADRGVRHRGSASANRAVPDRSAQIVAKLDEPVRSILKMRLWDRRSFEEIGRALGKPASAVVSHYQLALVKLKKLMAAPPAPADSSSDSSEAGAPAAE